MTGNGEQFFIQADEKTPSVEEPGVKYVAQKDDPFWDVRSLLDQYEKRISVLEAEMREVKAVVEKKE